jgi:hypothetical protein
MSCSNCWTSMAQPDVNEKYGRKPFVLKLKKEDENI